MKNYDALPSVSTPPLHLFFQQVTPRSHLAEFLISKQKIWSPLLISPSPLCQFCMRKASESHRLMEVTRLWLQFHWFDPKTPVKSVWSEFQWGGARMPLLSWGRQKKNKVISDCQLWQRCSGSSSFIRSGGVFTWKEERGMALAICLSWRDVFALFPSSSRGSLVNADTILCTVAYL